jgi:hypothetical protein
MQIICYAGGTCGDLVVALLDPRGVEIDQGRVRLPTDRMRLKKPHRFTDDKEKQGYLDDIVAQYHSVPSHDLDYHVDHGHSFIGVTVKDWNLALWAAHRFQALHAPHVWQEMQRACGASTVEHYAEIVIHFGNLVATKTDRLITLESIMAGTVLPQLQELTGLEPDRRLYQHWLDQQV